MRAAAVLCVRNEAVHVAAALGDLIADGLDVVLIDHDSTDETVAVARPFLGRGLLAIERLPWTGSFSIRDQLDAKHRVVEGLDHDWILHADADEWHSTPLPGRTLLEGLREADEAGFNAVAFREFVFVPRRGEDLYRPDYRRRALRYYYFRPEYPYVVRAWKHRSGLDNREYAGHALTGPMRLFPYEFLMRHYVALSEAHAARKYVGRRFSESELARGFHFDRVGLTAESLRFPADDAPNMRTLDRWSSKSFDTSYPVLEHYWRWNGLATAAG